MNKNIIKETMLSLEAYELESAREKYLDYVVAARIDRTEPVENDEQAQAELASDFSEALDDNVHDHSDKIDKLAMIDFSPKRKVEEGAIVTIAGRHYIISVSTGKFVCDGKEFIGISAQAPIYGAIEDLVAGDKFEFNGRSLLVESIS